jgi:hypothetical protein
VWVSDVRPAPVQPEVPKTVGQLAARPVEQERVDLHAAALAGAGAVSNAAAGGAARSRDAAPGPRDAASEPKAARPALRSDEREVLDLIWFEAESLPRMRKKPPWRRLLDELENQIPDPELDDPEVVEEPKQMEERREVFEILAQGEPTDAEGIYEALHAAVRADGRFLPPLVLVAGELSMPFDELEALKATVTTVTPLANDENLRSTLATAREFLETPELLAAPAVAEGMTTRIKDAFAAGKRVVAQGYLEAQTERVLLDKRHYQRRSLFKARRLRALLHLPSGAAPIPTYLPDDLAEALPLYQRFKVRLVVEVNLRADQYETQPVALKALALMRASPLPPPVPPPPGR